MMFACVTVDVESDWGGRSGDTVGLKRGLPAVLSVLKKFDVPTTFFVSGSIVAGNADLLKPITGAGHEIASHGFVHDYTGLTDEELADDVRKSKEVIKKELGASVSGFRAPQFRIHENLFTTLSREGFKYDSSVVGCSLPGRYEKLCESSKPFMVGGIYEFPVSTIPVVNIPFGLLWANTLGGKISRMLAGLKSLPDPVVFYLHPFDILPEKGGGGYGFPIKTWYSFRQKNAEKTFMSVLSFLKKERAFMTLSELCKSLR